MKHSIVKKRIGFFRNAFVLFVAVLLLFAVSTQRANQDVDAAAADEFVTTWKTDNPGTSNSTSITIPVFNTESYNYDVDWNNDGTFDEFGLTGSVTHNFGTAGTKTIRIKGTFPRIYFANGGDKSKILSVDQWGTGAWTSMEKAFYGANNLVINASDTPNLSSSTTLLEMFRGATSVGGGSGNWSWNTATITNMSSVFYGATSFNKNISSWNTASATNMFGMFNGASSFNQNISAWNTSNVTNMSSMFTSATNFNQSIGSWDTTKVTNMVGMFAYAEQFNQNISGWNTAAVTDMNQMFFNAFAFNQPIGSWNTANVTNMSSMFSGARAFNQSINAWNTGNVTNMSTMFKFVNQGTSTFNQPIGSWNTSKVTTMYQMFNGAIAFNQDIGAWDVSKVTNMSSMFNGATAFNNGTNTNPINNWNTALVSNMSTMFNTAESFNRDVGSWNTAAVTDMSYMFRRAYAFNKSLSSWNTANVTNMAYLFENADAFNQDISAWNTGKVTSMSWMFYSANTFDQNIGSWDVSKVTNASNMLTQSKLSTNNYDALLNGWNTRVLKTSVSFSGGNSNYCNGVTARTNIISAYSWTITDAGLDCTDANSDPTNITLSNNSIDENVSNPTTVGSLSTTDPDATDTHIYTVSCTSAGADDDSFQIANGNELQITISPNYETKSSYLICLRTTDNKGSSYDKNFTINVNDLNAAPTDITLISSAVDENVAGGTTVGSLSATDDGEDTNSFTYSLVAGTGDTDNSAFTITGGAISVNNSPDYETKASYAIRIQADDGVNTYEKAFTIIVNDIDDTAPATPICSTSPSSAAPGTSVTTTCTGVEEDATVTIPNMTCLPTPADGTGVVVCTGTVGSGGSDVSASDDTVTVTDLAGNPNTSATTGLTIGTDTDGDGNLDDVDPDDDGDNVSDAEENAGPNSGDANNDGMLDSLQANVTSLVNPFTGLYNTLQTEGCEQINSFQILGESELGAEDKDYTYELGLWDFEINCMDNGDTASLTFFTDQNYDTSNWQQRKYDETFKSISEQVTFATASNGEKDVTIVSYDITDGSDLDQDRDADGTIIDPSGPAIQKDADLNVNPDSNAGLIEALANTGHNAAQYVWIAGLFILLGFAAMASRAINIRILQG